MLGSLVNLGQRVCALVNDLAPKERTAEQPSLRWRGSRGGRRSKTLSRAPRMVKASVTFHGESVVELSRQSLNSVPSSWGSSRSLAVPRRWTPVHFSPLSPGVPWSKYHSFETVQSLPATPVPPSSPTFSEPPLPFLAPNTDAYDDQRCGTPGECVISSTCNGRPFRLRPFAQSSTADGKGCFKPTYGLEAIREGIESRSYFNNIDLAPNAVGPQAPSAQGRTKWAPMEPKERTSQTEPVKTAVPQNPWHNGSAYPVGNAAEAPRSRSWSNPGADSHHPSSDDIQLSANLNFQKPFSCSTRDMASDCYGASSTNASHDFFKPYLRGPMFKATARTGQPAVWSPKTRAPAGSTGLSGGRAPAQEAHLAPLAQANSGVSRSQPTGAWPGDVLPSEIQRGGAQLLPWELPTEPSVSSSAAAGPVQEGAPPPPPPPPMGQNTAGAFVGQEATKQTALPNESNAEGRSTVVIPETESVASLRSKIQSQLTMARPKQRFQQAQVEVTDERSWPAPAEPTGSIKDRAKELELKRLASAGRPVTEEEQPVQVRTEEHAFSRLRSPTPQALNHGPTSLTSNESSCRTPMLSDFRSPSPPTIPPTPVELLSPTSRSDLPSYAGNYAGVGRFPSDSWASRTLNRAPARQTFQTSTIQRNTSKQERRPSKDYQHQWYKMMFKKLHQIDKNEDSAVMHYRIRDHLGEKPVRDKSPSQRPQQSHANERSRQFLSPEPAPPDTAMTYRYNRSKSVGRSSSPASSAAALSLPTDAKHSSNAAVGFRHQPRRIEDYTPGHSSIIEDAIAAKEASGSASENQTSIQAMLDNSQGLIQRILGDLSREVEQHKMALQNYSDIGSSMTQRQKHQVPRCKSALDHPRNFNVGASEAHARKSELSRIADHDRISVEQRKADSVGNYGRPVLARVLYSFVSQNPRELDLYPDDTVTIRRQIDANWCEGEVDGRVGIFPTNYVEPYTEKSTNDTRGTAGARRGRSMAKVLYDFVARRPRELTIKQGEVVHLIREVDRNWSLGCNEHGQEGIFPSHYVRPCDGMAERKPVDTLTQRKGYQSHLGHPGFASAFDGHSTFGSRSTDRVSKLMIDGVSYGSGAKADSLDAILNEMKLYSSSLLDSKSSKPLPKQPPSVGMTANHNLPYASKIDTYEAVYDYMPENPDELELKRGDIVYVVESYDDGWFIGTSLRTGRFGMFPGNYVKRL